MKVLLILLFILCWQAQAVTTVFPPAKDNTVYQTFTLALSNGQGPYFFSGRTLNQTEDLQIRRGLIEFDISIIPVGSTINQVTLNLDITSFRSNSAISLHRATAAWGEGVSDAGTPGGTGTIAEAYDATWLHALFDFSTWTNIGGDFAAIESASQAFSNTGPLSLSSAGMVADVQDWVDGNTANHGWFILGDESSAGTAVRFASREHETASVRPSLVIDYSPPLTLVQLNPSKDNTLYESDTGSLSNGAGDRLFLGLIQTGEIRRGLLEFDFSVLPPGAIVESAQLDLSIQNIPSGTAQNGVASLHPVLAEWGEAGSNGSGNGATAQPGDATWLHREFSTVFWSQAGGDFDLASATGPFTATGSSITFASTADLVADVNGWIQAANSNHGWALLGDEANNGNARSVGSTDSGNQPILTLEYHLPADLIFSNGFEP